MLRQPIACSTGQYSGSSEGSPLTAQVNSYTATVTIVAAQWRAPPPPAPQVVRNCGRLLGRLSRRRLESIVARFLLELHTPSEPGQLGRLRSDSTAARQELFQLCEGLKYVEFRASNSAEVTPLSNVRCSVNSAVHKLQPPHRLP